MTQEIQQAATAYKLALERCLISVEAVEQWVDDLIAYNPHPDSWMVDLSYACTQGRNEAIAALNEILNNTHSVASWDVLRPIILKHFESEAQTMLETIQMLQEMDIEGSLCEALSLRVSNIVDAWGLAAEVGSPMVVVEEMLRALLRGQQHEGSQDS